MKMRRERRSWRREQESARVKGLPLQDGRI